MPENDLIHIPVELYQDEDNLIPRLLYETSMKGIFPDFETYRKFMLEVGTNHPEGVSYDYLIYLVKTYTMSLSIQKLKDLGLVEEVYADDGSIAYKFLAE